MVVQEKSYEVEECFVDWNMNFEEKAKLVIFDLKDIEIEVENYLVD
jgi:hypothetical protein